MTQIRMQENSLNVKQVWIRSNWNSTADGNSTNATVILENNLTVSYDVIISMKSFAFLLEYLCFICYDALEFCETGCMLSWNLFFSIYSTNKRLKRFPS